MKKSILVCLLALSLALALCCCGGKAEAADMTPAEQLKAAQELVGQSARALYDTIGEPAEASYASSCIGEGEDGELSYEGFHVYTYRAPDGAEVVQDVLEVS